jgi:hypothetical protein
VRHRRWKRATLFVTLAGVAAVAAGVLFLWRDRGRDERSEATLAEMRRIAEALAAYHREHATLPSRLSQLTSAGSSFQGDVVPEDSWRCPIDYRVSDAEAGEFVLRSRGADREPGTGDDLLWPRGSLWSNDAPKPVAGEER